MKKFTWFYENKVAILGTIGAVAATVYDYLSNGETSVKIMVFAALATATSFLANKLRGQAATLCSVLGTLFASVLANTPETPISWIQIVLQGLILFIGANTGPAKSVGYERSSEIKQAKQEGERLVPTLVPPKP